MAFARWKGRAELMLTGLGANPCERRAVAGPASRSRYRLPICIQWQSRSAGPWCGNLARPFKANCKLSDMGPGAVVSGGRAETI